MNFERVFETEQIVPAPRDEVFAFFALAENLERITPPFLNFRILTPQPIRMYVGARIDYQLRLRGLPIWWQTEIAAWNPPDSFVDVQLRGPYSVWHHTHRFVDLGGGATRMTDTVRWAAPFGPLGWLAAPLLVKPELDRIFAYRREAIEGIFRVRR